MGGRYSRGGVWRIAEVAASLTAVAPNTSAAYQRDLAGFVEWASRAGLAGPAEVDRIVLRRYLAFLTTRGFAPRSRSRKASALRRYFAWLHHIGEISSDPARSLSSPKGEGRLPRVLSAPELTALLDEPPAALGD